MGERGDAALAGLVTWLLRRDVTGRLLRGALVATLAVVAAFLLAPGSSVRRLPTWDALSTPAPGTIKADRDYEIVDEEATARRRAEASAAQRAVYDLDEGAVEDASARIHAAFSVMREEEELLRGTGGRREPTAAELARVYAAQRDAFVSRLGLLVRDVDLEALGAARFGTPVEAELVALTARGLEGMVVSDLQLLNAERGRGVLVRVLRGGEPGEAERTLLDLSQVRDLAIARQELEQAAASRLHGLPAPLRGALARVAQGMLAPTLVHNHAETARRRAEAAAGAKPVVIAVKRGEKIIGDGERIEKRHLLVFDGMRAQARASDLGWVRVGGGLLVALAITVLWRFARRNLARLRIARRDALLLAALLLATLTLGFVAIAVADALHERFAPGARPALYFLVPFAAGAMLVRQVLAAEVALLFAVVVGIVAGLLGGQSIPLALHATLTAIASAGLVGVSRDRSGLFRSGLAVGAVGAVLAAALALYGARGPADVALGAAAALVGGAIVLPVVVLGSLPIVEGAFGYLTDVRLLELANLNHPALKELIVHAPGTYHHSIVMGAMVEAAAQAIGANPLLARVGAYYHDVGKIRNPQWFAENQRGENRHEAVAPSMSALVIKRHVADGIELAQQWQLPRAIVEIVQQHHGTRFVGYFWAMVQRSGDEGKRGEVVDEAVFRYPGPRPQTREAALVMIADSCEASARAMEAPTAEDFGGLVSRRVNEIFSEGQLDECELTLKDLSVIASAMVRALEAVYHTRPDYPIGEAAELGRIRPPIQLVVRK
ncbi:MAG TPA: HDIG domain-containing protein [Anaeromyxobacteraceae bacterium]|nr:HDIG domain-containing protein [Anaeromyxobacteraceae bacterium]